MPACLLGANYQLFLRLFPDQPSSLCAATEHIPNTIDVGALPFNCSTNISHAYQRDYVATAFLTINYGLIK
ncbi:hypothetical protein ACLOJK_021252 [Asimina triloba]